MSKTEILGIAKDDTPDHVEIPPTWAGVGVWLLGKYGVGAIFMGMVLFLYHDLTNVLERYYQMSDRTVRTLESMIGRMDQSAARVEEMRETVRRIETAATSKK
jgi:hypothetical protein